MTVLELSQDTTGLASMSPHVDRLVMRLSGTVEKLSGAPVDAEITQAFEASARTFLEQDGHPLEAADAMALRLHQLGVHQARAGRTRSDLQAAFSLVRVDVMAELKLLAGPALVGLSMTELRVRVAQYLEALCRHALNGVDDHERWLERERDRLRSSYGLNRQRSVSAGEHQVAAEDRTGSVRAVVAVNRELPQAIRDDPAFGQRESRFEVLVPESVDMDELATRLTGPVVYGPLTSWAEMPEALTLVWRAAEQVRSESAGRLLISCDELAGDLVLSDNPVLRRLLVRKHLTSLASIPASRRAVLSESLLAWLERGCSLTQLAADMNLPTQTLHTRITVLRDMFGDVLDDPTQRLELIVALRTMMPTWLAKAS